MYRTSGTTTVEHDGTEYRAESHADDGSVLVFHHEIAWEAVKGAIQSRKEYEAELLAD
jgi:hypothetical protein